MTRRKILITGATGGVGQALLERLSDDYEIVPHGHTPDDSNPKNTVYADLANYDEALPLMDGVDTVVHMAGAASPESTWDEVLDANIIGFRNTLEAAREAGVRRFVFASSNHINGMYDREEDWPVYPNMPPRPDSLYGVSKAFGETLGKFYHEEHGIDFISLRIGWVAEDPSTEDLDLLHAMWLSEDDAARVVKRAIEAEATFGLYYAISDNPNRRWSMTNTTLELGYRPEDTVTDHISQENPDQPTPDTWPEGS